MDREHSGQRCVVDVRSNTWLQALHDLVFGPQGSLQFGQLLAPFAIVAND
jgi:hypothetical protein